LSFNARCDTLVEMNAAIVSEVRVHDAVSSLVIVPLTADRNLHGYRLAAPMISDEPKEQDLVLRGEHPDLLLLTPAPGKESVGIDQVRAIIRSAQFTPVQGKRKVCLIPYAEALTLEAGNAFLKILEEPPRRLVFLLLAAQPNDVLPTILSRSRVVRGLAPSVRSRLDQLAKAGYEEKERRYLERALRCEGELDPFLKSKQDLAALQERAKRQLDEASDDALITAVTCEDPILRYEGVVTLFARLVAGDNALAITAAVKLARKGKGGASRLLVDCLQMGYEMLRGGMDGDSSGVSGAEFLPALTKPVDVETLLRLIRSVEDTRRAVEGYAPLEACLLTVFLGMTRGEDD